ncbi:hypothetical protein PUN28_013359 [Cardiocondyla obscurior]|uniref:Uncharacterized protein n=1 Tax=Cardiocondyla obscurior TaxID=286306 RepID=A0AAW2F847_9HYME
MSSGSRVDPCSCTKRRTKRGRDMKQSQPRRRRRARDSPRHPRDSPRYSRPSQTFEFDTRNRLRRTDASTFSYRTRTKPATTHGCLDIFVSNSDRVLAVTSSSTQ